MRFSSLRDQCHHCVLLAAHALGACGGIEAIDGGLLHQADILLGDLHSECGKAKSLSFGFVRSVS